MVEVCKFAERVWDYGARRAWVIARGPGTDGEDMRGNLEILGRFWWARNTNSPPPLSSYHAGIRKRLSRRGLACNMIDYHFFLLRSSHEFVNEIEVLVSAMV